MDYESRLSSSSSSPPLRARSMTLAAGSDIEARLASITPRKKVRLPVSSRFSKHSFSDPVEEDTIAEDTAASSSSTKPTETDPEPKERNPSPPPSPAPAPAEESSPSLSNSKYVQLLRKRIDTLEAQLSDQQAEIQSLHTQRSAQAAELQQILLSSMQRTRQQTQSAPSARMESVVSALGSISSDASTGAAHVSQSMGCASSIQSAILTIVGCEGELHRCAMMQYNFLKFVDAERPQGMTSDDMLQIER